MARVTVVNDNPDFLELVGDILEDDRYEVTLIDGDGPDALGRIKSSRPDVLMIDLRVGPHELHGWEVAQEVRRDPSFESTPILICSADMIALAEIEDQLEQTHDVVVLAKPFKIEELTERIDALLAAAPAP
jgi:CheY-like chemotaxis protein